MKNQKVLVCGMAKSGISASLLLVELGANVTLQDQKQRAECQGIEGLEEQGITLYFGKNPDDIVENQDMLVLSPGIPTDLPFIQKARQKNIPVIGEIELAYLQTNCPITAITGTNGKTTTTTLVGEMMKEVYKKSVVVGNIGIGYSEKVMGLTKEDWVTVEMSSFQLESIDKFHPHISSVLNITPDHLNRHKTMETYIKMKERIFENQIETDFCILNYDDEICRAMKQKMKANVLYFSSSEVLEEGIFIQKEAIYIRYQTIFEKVIDLSDLKILGTHNHENVMATIGMAYVAGISILDIQKVLGKFTGVAHRIEYAGTLKGVKYYNDSKATNVDAGIRGILAMPAPTILIGGGYDKESNFDEWTKLFKGRVKELILIGATKEQIAESAKKHDFHNITYCETFEEAMNMSEEKAEEGDCVLLSPACASWGMFRDYEERGEQFKRYVANQQEIKNEK